MMRRLAVVVLSSAALAGAVAPAAHAAGKVSNPHHAKVVRKGVTKDGRHSFTVWTRKVYVHGAGWKRVVMHRRPARVVGHWHSKHFRYVRWNQRRPHGLGKRHRITRTPIISRETLLRRNIVRWAKSSLSSRTGYYRYSQGGSFSFDPTPHGRSDCSQWTAAIYKHATGRFIGGNTWAQIANGRPTRHPKPGDLMFSRNFGHVELYIGGGRTIGHGSAPIDYAHVGAWPGHFYRTFL